MKRIHILLIMFMCTLLVEAQGVTWSVDVNTIFDNREGDKYYSDNGTLFLTNVSPEIGLTFLNETHKIAGGVSWIQPCGNNLRDHKTDAVVYYRYNSPQWRMSFGVFPRSQFIERLPDFLLSDSIAYNQPNVRGLLIQYVKPRGYAELSLDWRSQQSETKREAFNVNFNGRLNLKKVFFIGGHAQLNHLAKQKNAPVGQSVNDDIMVNPYIGFNLSNVTSLDSLEIKTERWFHCSVHE